MVIYCHYEELYIDTRSVLAQNFGTKFAGEKEQSSDNLGHTYASRAGHRMSLNCDTVAISAAI